MWKNVVEPIMLQMTICYGTEMMQFLCQITEVRIQPHTYNI
jgi:hypothetical protein